MQSWIQRARARLAQARRDEGWGYLEHAAPSVEPTVLASLGLLATDEGERSLATARASSDWLTRLQQHDGHLGPSASQSAPGWPTSLALLLWAALDAEPWSRSQATAYLLGVRGQAYPRQPSSPFGHDTALQGWPWSEGTHSWVEPTALAVLALCRVGERRHPRVTVGLRLLGDRALPSGGWNYGNTTVFGRELRALPGPTGLALLALAAGGQMEACVERGLDYLATRLPATRAPQSLALGLLGLRAWGRDPAAVREALEAGLDATESADDAPLQAAHALLGAGPRSLALLGIGEGA